MSHEILIDGAEKALIGDFIESQAKDSQGNPAWLITKNGAVVLSDQFIQDGSIQMLKVTAP